jgi:hypothetical protein
LQLARLPPPDSTPSTSAREVTENGNHLRFSNALQRGTIERGLPGSTLAHFPQNGHLLARYILINLYICISILGPISPQACLAAIATANH